MFDPVLTGTAQLRDLYREPSKVVQDKITDRLDDACRSFIARSTFVLVASASAAGHVDVSPKGGPQGFVKVFDEQRLAIPDLSGNNLLDSLHNIVETGEIGLLFVVPGLGETLRVNGTAVVTTDDAVLDLFTDDVRRPTAAIGVTAREAYIHCAKSFRRGGIWQPETWPEPNERPSPAAALICHSRLTGVTAEQVETALEQNYQRELEAERPTHAE